MGQGYDVARTAFHRVRNRLLVDSLRRMQADLQVLKELKSRMAKVTASEESSEQTTGPWNSGRR